MATSTEYQKRIAELEAALAKAYIRLATMSISRAGEARNKEDGLNEIKAVLGFAPSMKG